MAVLAAGAIAVFVLVNGGGGDDDPMAVVETFGDAYLDGDCEAAAPLATDSFWNTDDDETNVEACESDFESMAQYIDEEGREVSGVELVSEDGDEAVVAATTGAGENANVVEFDLVREDGDWLIDGSGGGPTEPPEDFGTDFGSDFDPDEFDPEDFDIEMPDDFDLPDDFEVPELDDSGPGDALGSDDPEGVTVAFIEAAVASDCDAGVLLTTDAYWDEASDGDYDSSYAACESLTDETAPSPELVRTELTSEDGSTAVVDATFDDEVAGEVHVDFLLIREGSSWLIDGVE